MRPSRLPCDAPFAVAPTAPTCYTFTVVVRSARTNVQSGSNGRPVRGDGPDLDTLPRGARRDMLLAEIARAYYEQDLTQAQVAELHDISRSQVSRYLRAAREEGIVQIRIIAPGDRDHEAEQALRAAFPHLREAVVARVFQHDVAFLRRAVARAVANLLDRLVRPGQIVCVGAGRTLSQAASLMTPRRLDDVIVVPATGNAGHAAHESDYSAVARAIAAAWGATTYGINAPAILGPGASASHLERSNPHIREAIAAARRASIHVLGLGSLAGDEIFVRTGLISALELEVVRGAGAVGDLCGNFYDSAGDPVPGPFADRIVGIGLPDLRQAPRVIACAGGEEKTPAILGALRGRLVNHLVTDEHTAKGVLDVAMTAASAPSASSSRHEGGIP